jgi:hypothetical protein
VSLLGSSSGYEIACVIVCIAGTSNDMLRIFFEYSLSRALFFDGASKVIDSIARAEHASDSRNAPNSRYSPSLSNHSTRHRPPPLS